MTLDIILEIVVRLAQGGLMAWIWRMGGKIDKNYRRIIAPILIFICTRNIGAALMVAGLGRIPTTLIGDDLKILGQLFWWIPILCFLHSIPVFIVAGFWPAVTLLVLQCLMIWGSNLVDFPKWNWYEIIYGFVLGLVIN